MFGALLRAAGNGVMGAVFGAFLAAIALGVVLNYAMLLHAGRRHRDEPADPSAGLADGAVTVVVSASVMPGPP